MSADIDLQKMLDAIEKLVDASVDARVCSEEMRPSKRTGIKAARIDLERCIRKFCGLASHSQMMRAVSIEIPDPFGGEDFSPASPSARKEEK